MNRIRVAERKIDDLIDEFRRNGKLIPDTVKMIPEIPFNSSFEELCHAILSGQILIQRFAFEHIGWLFATLASTTEKLTFNFYLYLSFIGPVVSVILCFIHSWWWLLGILLLPVGISKTKRLYNRVIFSSAVSSETNFCFLYYIRQICLTTLDYRTSYYWNQERKYSRSFQEHLDDVFYGRE